MQQSWCGYLLLMKGMISYSVRENVASSKAFPIGQLCKEQEKIVIETSE